MAESKRSYGVKLIRGPFVRLPPHPLACSDPAELAAVLDRIPAPRAADLFCGAGGLSLGLAAAGYEVVIGIDHDDDALETHRAHHPGLSVNWDLSDQATVDRVAQLIVEHDIELVAGGPPCQPFSRAGRSMVRDLVRTGRRASHDRRRDLWEAFLGVVEQARPRAIVMENVPDMALDRGMVILRTMIERLERLGYTVEERVIDTWRYGVPQFRQRLILVALAGGIDFTWPTESANRVTVDNAIGDLPPVEGGWRPSNGGGPDPVASGWAVYEGPRTDFQRRARDGVRSEAERRVFDHITRPVREDDAVAFASMNPETRYSELSPDLKRYRDDIFDDKYKRLDPNDLGRTITAHIAKDGYWYIHPYQDRTLTLREAARFQTFPDWVRFAGPPTSAFRQIGNAVPVELGLVIGTAVRESLRVGHSSAYTTHEVADALASWFTSRDPVAMPWLASATRWSVIQAEILWSRLGDSSVGHAWAAVRSLDTPRATLEARELLGRLADHWQRRQRFEHLIECASWMVENPECLDSSGTADDLARAPHVTGAVADLACRVVPGDTEDPVLAGFGSLRVAARFQGASVDRRNKLSDGRLALARMVGGDESSHAAHLALVELANGICGPGTPECSRCPLERWCVEAASRPVQTTLLPPTSPAELPMQETAIAASP